MLDLRALLDDPASVHHSLARRNQASLSPIVDELVALVQHRRALQGEADGLRGQRNALSKQIGGLMKQGDHAGAQALKDQVAANAQRLTEIEAEEASANARERELVLTLPNVVHPEAPDGKGEEDNRELRRWGTPPTFSFEPQAHVEVGTKLGILDLERAAKLTGARFAVLKGAGAALERALVSFFLDTATREHGYTELLTPYIVHAASCVGTGQLPKFADDMFKLAEPLNGGDAYLISTAEIPVTNLHREEILDAADMPVKYCAFSPCFRAEAGSAGRDVRGLIRTHQFHKVELVWLTTAERAAQDHLTLLGHAEVLLQRLGLAYRVVELCTGDTSFSAHRTYDIEVWLPTQGYREISSVSWFTDFQARRMQLRVRPQSTDGTKAKPVLAHTLNGSGLAVGRTLVALLENYQQEDGSVVIPEVLRGYLGGLDVIRPTT